MFASSLRSLWSLVAMASVLGLAATSVADDKPAGVDPQQLDRVVTRAINYLASQGQAEDGSFSGASGPGVTALVTTAILRNGRTPDDPLVARSLKYLESFVQDDGGIYQEGTFHNNYETCLAMLCFAEANRGGRYDDVLAGAERFVRGIQWDESEGRDKSDFSYGGAGYGRHQRPDLSNTAFLIDALRSVGAGEDDPAIQKALIFVSRCQNLETEHNLTPHSTKNPDGGFYYTAAAGGQSMAGETPQGGLRSYGSMTYAGLKSMIHAGVGPDDPRVKAALEWIQRHYGLDANPGMGDAGLFYYYHTFAKALHAMGLETVEDDEGRVHDWRDELVAELARRQRDDGSWLNDNNRWLEGDPNLVTGYALLALSYCRPAAN